MTHTPTRIAALKRLLASLAAIMAVTTIFGAKAFEAEQALAAQKAAQSPRMATVR